jgi:SNF2 family DNA or RNA helicase
MAHKSSYDVVFPFGKHNNKSLGFVYDSDPGYIRWMAGNEKMPGNWSEACKLILEGKDISHLDLPRQIYKKTVNLNIEMWTVNKSTIGVSFAYDRELLERFKFEIDGRKWNKEDRHWEVPAPQIVKMVELFGGPTNISADDGVKKMYREEIKRRKHLDEIRVKEDTDIEIPTKLDLFPYQKVGVEFVIRAGGRAMIADSMGLGKTVQAIGYAAYNGSKTLIICPKSVVVGWAREIERFTGKKATIWSNQFKHTPTPTTVGKITNGSELLEHNNQYHLIHYNAVEKRAQELRAAKFDLLVCDEATYIKNRKTKRAKSILGDSKDKKLYPGIKTKEVIFLTGTPILNRPIEAFTLLNFLDPNRFNNFYQFAQKYGGWQGSEPRNLDDLHERTKDLVIRRLKKDILTELPAKQRNDLYVELTPAEHKEYEQLLQKLFRKWRSLGKPTIAEMPTIQNYLISKKMPRLHEMVDEMLEQDRGVLIYCCYVEPLKQLAKHYGDKAAIIHGQMTTTERQKSIDALKSGKAKVGLFSLGAGAMGIDGLQYSIDTVIFLDRWWVPAIHEQAEDRLFRIGQTKQVQAYYMTCEGTIDEDMSALLSEKMSVVEQIVDGQIISNPATKSVFGEFVNKLKKRKNEEFRGLDLSDLTSIPDLPL